MSRYVMVVDSTKCINCKACVVACQQRNKVPFGHSRNWVRETVDATTPLGKSFQPGACMHCRNPVCVDACPTHATYADKDGSVVIDPARCIGCGGCIAACPYNARYKNNVTGVADKCDYCRRSTPGQSPACVQICPVHCRVFGDADNPADPVARLLEGNTLVHVTPVGCDTKPSLTYLKRTVPTDWPQARRTPPMLAALGPAATTVKWLGGLALFGVVGVFVKQLVLPSAPSSHSEGDDRS